MYKREKYKIEWENSGFEFFDRKNRLSIPQILLQATQSHTDNCVYIFYM